MRTLCRVVLEPVRMCEWVHKGNRKCIYSRFCCCFKVYYACVVCVCAQNIHDVWYNTDECRSFCGIQRDPFKVKSGESDGEGIGNSDQRDTEGKQGNASPTLEDNWTNFGSSLTLLTNSGVFPIQGCSAQTICPNDPVAWEVYRHHNVDDWIRISPWFHI